MTIDPKILERITKLNAHAESAKAIGSEQEALTFAAAVQQLLEKYNLSMSDVEFRLHQAQNPIKMHLHEPAEFGRKAKKVGVKLWENLLATAIVDAHDCDLIWQGNTNSLFIIGRKQNRQVAEYMLVVLFMTAEKLAEQAYTKFFYQCRDEGDVTKARGFRQNFLLGFATRIRQRYEQERSAKDREYAASNTAALVRLSQEKALVRQATQEIGEKLGLTTSALNGPSLNNIHGLVQGASAAELVAIRGTGLHAGGKGPAQVSPGQKLLGGGA